MAVARDDLGRETRKQSIEGQVGINFRGHLISRKKGRHISRVFIFAIWAQNYFLRELIFAKMKKKKKKKKEKFPEQHAFSYSEEGLFVLKSLGRTTEDLP